MKVIVTILLLTASVAGVAMAQATPKGAAAPASTQLALWAPGMVLLVGAVMARQFKTPLQLSRSGAMEPGATWAAGASGFKLRG